MEWLPALVVYVIAVAAYALMQRRQFARDLAKVQRYTVLPLHYELACWCLVLPLIVAVPLILWMVFDSPYLAALAHVLGLGAFAGLEIACVSVYRRNGLWD
ncbi:hypothetical protein [Steroidobacter gossypii]|uniref:hypothetical protein n=1 Tax=Steroidobacter gossypii TaxID=2805490 RepID=UPI001C3F8CE0|nr:hypothetical protein [Steroidobacter gossypii]